MKKLIGAAKSSNKSSKANYLDPKTRFNDDTFNDDEMYDAVGEFLYYNGIAPDDLKANISSREYYEDNEFEVNCKFSWIFYPEDVPKKDFKKVSNKIEKLFKNKFKSDDWFEVDCIRYDDSEYSQHGYDVELILRIHYGLIPDEDIDSSTNIYATSESDIKKRGKDMIRIAEVKAPSKRYEKVFEAANRVYKNWCDNFDEEFADYFADEDEDWGPEDMTKSEKIDAMLECIESELYDKGFSDSEITQVVDASDKFRKLLNSLI